MMLSGEQKARLLSVARQAIEAAVTGAPAADTQTDDTDLKKVQGAFVTLKKQGQLRGCIGHIEGHLPLIETVNAMAVAAALEDPRFPPVRADELDDLTIEISVMSPIMQVNDIEEIQVGRDGLIVSAGPYRGLLLPQVAVEWGWNCEEFLCHTCLKAGLPEDAWQGDVTIERFEAEVFGEETEAPE
jgi:AmmeMemoRadiSam system protein A